MKVLVVGLGSMGKRRVRNLHALGLRAIAGVDVREDRRQEASTRYGVETFATMYHGLEWRPDAVVISTPPDLHAPCAFRAVEAGVPFFTEAGLPDERWPAVVRAMARRNVVGVPSCTMRYYPGPKTVAAHIRSGAIGRPMLWTYHSGQYLPDWHPWESIETFYVGQRATGGCRELVAFELAWLLDVFGAVSSVQADRGKFSALPVDIDDVYQLQLRHVDAGVGHLTVDVLARTPVRQLRAIGTDGTLEWDGAAQTVRLFDARAKAWTERSLEKGTVETGYVNPEEPYIEEMRDFLAAVRRERPPAYTFTDDAATLDVLLAAERSADAAQRIACAAAVPTLP